MNKEEFDKLMEKERNKGVGSSRSIGKRVSDESKKMGLAEEGLRGLARAPLNIASFRFELLDAALRGGKALGDTAARAVGVSDEVMARSNNTPLGKFSVESVNKKILNQFDKVKESGPLAPSESVSKGWREGIKDPNWWVGNLSEAASFSVILARMAGKEVKKQATKQIGVLTDKAATKAAKVQAGKELSKISAKSIMAKSAAIEAGGQHGEYRKWEKENPDDATAIGDATATMFGAAAGSVEGLAIGKMLAAPFVKKFGKDAATKAATSFWKEFAKAAPKDVLIEGGTEAVQEMINNTGKMFGYDADTEFMDGVVESAIIGGVVGGGFGAGEAYSSTSGRTQQEKDSISLKNVTKKLEVIKGDIEKYKKIQEETEPGSTRFKAAGIKLDQALTALTKSEAEVNSLTGTTIDSEQLSPENKPVTNDPLEVGPTPTDNEAFGPSPTDKEAFGTSINPELTIEEIAVGIDDGTVTPEQWAKAPKDNFTDEQIAIVDEHVADVKNSEVIDKIIAGENIEPEPDQAPASDQNIDEATSELTGGPVDDKSVDGTTGSPIFPAMNEDATDKDLVAMFNEGTNKFLPESNSDISVSSEPVSEPIQQMSDLLGVRIVKTKNSPANGGVLPNNGKVIFMDESISRPEMWLLGHEFGHSLEQTNPKAFKVLFNVAIEGISPKELKNKVSDMEKSRGKGNVTNRQAAREMLSDFMGSKFNDKNFWAKVHKKNPSRFKEIINSLRQFIAKITSSFKGVTPESDKFFNNILDLESTLVGVLNEHVGYTGAIEAINKGPAPTGETTDLNANNQHVTHIPIGSNGQIVLREDGNNIYIKRFARSGARLSKDMAGLTQTTEGKGDPTQVLDDLKAYAEKAGKTIIAETGNNQYFIDQGFVDNGKVMTWTPAGRGTEQASGSGPVASPPASDKPATSGSREAEKADEAKRKAEKIRNDEKENRRIKLANSIRDIEKSIQNEKDALTASEAALKNPESSRNALLVARDGVKYAKEQLAKFTKDLKAAKKEMGSIIAEQKAIENKKIKMDALRKEADIKIAAIEKDIVVWEKSLKKTDSEKEANQIQKEILSLNDQIISIKEGLNDTKSGKQISGTGQQGNKAAGNAQHSAKGKKANSSNRNKQSKKKTEEAIDKILPKSDKLSDKIDNQLAKEEVKKKGGVASQLKAITVALSKAKKSGDASAFVEAIYEAGIEINTNTEEVAYQRAFTAHMRGELNDGIKPKKKVKKRKPKRSKKKQIELNVLTAMLAGNDNEVKRGGSVIPLTQEEIIAEVAKFHKDLAEQDQFCDDTDRIAGIRPEERDINAELDSVREPQLDVKDNIEANGIIAEVKRDTGVALVFNGIQSGYGMTPDLNLFTVKEGDPLDTTISAVALDSDLVKDSLRKAQKVFGFTPQFDVKEQVDANRAFVSPLIADIQKMKLSTKLPKKLPAGDWMGIFNKHIKKGKLNANEVEFTYLNEWLTEQGNKKVSREDVINYLSENAPYVTSTVNTDANSDDLTEKKFNENFTDPESAIRYISNVIKKWQEESGILINPAIRDKNPIDTAAGIINESTNNWNDTLTTEQKITRFRNHQLGSIIYGKVKNDNTSYNEFYIDADREYTEIYDAAYAEFSEGLTGDASADIKAKEVADAWLLDEYGYTRDEFDNNVESFENVKYAYYSLNGGYKKYSEQLIKYSPLPYDYTGTGGIHWGESNVLVHLRYDEHDLIGKKDTALMIYETQSDWQSDISKEGKSTTEPATDYINKYALKIRAEIETTAAELGSDLSIEGQSKILVEVLKERVKSKKGKYKVVSSLVNDMKGVIPSMVKKYYKPSKTMESLRPKASDLTKYEIVTIVDNLVMSHANKTVEFGVKGAFATANENITNAISAHEGDSELMITHGVPKAPFEKTWPLLAFKHAMIQAYNRGNKYVAWPSTAEQIAEIEGWGDRRFDAVIDHYTKEMPKQVGNFVNKYGGKVEQIKIFGNHVVNAVEITPQLEEMVINRQVPQFDLKDPIDPKDPHPAVEERFNKARNINGRTWIETANNWRTALTKMFTSHIAEIRPGKKGYFKDQVRLAKEADKYGSQQAFSKIYGIIGRLTNDERTVFTMNIVLNDLLNDTTPNEDGVSILSDGHLPWGFKTVSEVRESTRHFREQARKSPRIMRALAIRRKEMLDIQGKLIDEGYLPNELRGNDSYFHHEVIQKMREGDSYLFGTERKAGDKNLAFTNERGQDVGEYMLDYITSEFSMMSNAIATLRLQEIKGNIKRRYDITPNLEKRAGSGIITPPKGFETWSPSQYSGWGASPHYPDILAQNIISEAKINPDVKAKMQIASGIKEEWIIPEEMAQALRRIRSIGYENVVGKASEAFTRTWKIWTLINPLGAFRYNVNNFSGDVDIAMAYDYRIMKYAKQSMIDILSDMNTMGMKLPFNAQRFGGYLTPDLKTELKQAHKLGVIGAGFVMHEITDVAGEFEALMRGPQGGAGKKFALRWWQGTKDVTNFRENIIRLAAYRYFRDRLATGEKNIYGASNPAEIDDVNNMDEKAAKLSRELIGDYGRLTEGGEWMRKHLIPFYAWIEINAPRYIRMMRNLPKEGNKKGVAVGMAWKASVLGTKFMAFSAIVSAWNMLMFGDDEDELYGYQKKNMHILLGRRSDGTIRSLPVAGAFKDMLSWVDGEDAYYDITDILSGKATVEEKLKEAGKAPLWKFYNSTRPIFRSVGGVATGFTTFPGNEPRPIRDKFQYVAQVMSLDLLYKWAAGKPTRGLSGELENSLYWNVDPGESAYYEIRNKVNGYNKNVGRTDFRTSPTKKSNALYYYKQALRYADLTSAERYWKSYIELGGKQSGLNQSIKLAKPTGGLYKKDRRGFYGTLSDKDKRTLNLASKWYRNTYSNLHRKP